MKLMTPVGVVGVWRLQFFAKRGRVPELVQKRKLLVLKPKDMRLVIILLQDNRVGFKHPENCPII